MLNKQKKLILSFKDSRSYRSLMLSTYSCRLTMAAQELVQAARGRLIGRIWRGKPENPDENDEKYLPMASVDDISVMVVPLYPYLCEHRQWLKSTQQERRYSTDAATVSVNDAAS